MFTNIVMTVSLSVFGLIIGLTIGYLLGRLKEKRLLDKAKNGSEKIIASANREADQLVRDSQLKMKEEFLTQKEKIEEVNREREEEISKYERDVNKKEKEIIQRESDFTDLEKELEAKSHDLHDLKENLTQKSRKYDEIIELQNKRLEMMSGVSKTEALDILKENLIDKAKKETAQISYDIRQETKNIANREAKEIIATAIERVCTDYVQESTLAAVSLPNDKIKGMIIGKEGRNIKAFENYTNVKVIVDETPETVVLSSFDPVRREIARVAMEKLIREKNINPNTIEKIVDQASAEVEVTMKKAAEATLQKLQLKDVHPDLMKMLGRLKYRTSYGQNILHHSMEVASLAGAMAAELGLDVSLAKRAGLFHDIGKAMSSDSNASHVELGVEITERCNEHPVVTNAVLAHHEEAEPIAPEAVLVTAADKISGARPGARRETLEAYTQRIGKLEELANSFDGVAKTFALSAGREIRVIVEPENVSDGEADLLARNIAEKIEASLEYPGQIKVTVLRRLVTTQYTDFRKNNHVGESVAGNN